MNETTYAHRTDSIPRKIELLQQALADNRRELAQSLAESIRETITFEQQTEEEPGEIDLRADGGLPASELPAPWRNWVVGWRRYVVFALDETVGLARRKEPVEINVRFATNHTARGFRDVRLVRVDAATGTLAEVPSQFLDEQVRSEYRYGRLLFQADNPAHQRTTYRSPRRTPKPVLLFDNPDAELRDYPTDLRIEGKGYKLDIENRFYRASRQRSLGRWGNSSASHTNRAAA